MRHVPRTPRALVITALTLSVLTAGLAPTVPAAEAGAPDGAIVHLDPVLQGIEGGAGVVRPVTLADGTLHYLWTVEVAIEKEAEDGRIRWSLAGLQASSTAVSVEEVNADNRTFTWSGAGHIHGIVDNPDRLLITMPAEELTGIEGLVRAASDGHAGYFNSLKTATPPEAADPLDTVPEPVTFVDGGAGTYAFSATLEVVPTNASSYEVHVSTDSPHVETTTLSGPHGTAPVTLDASNPAVVPFTGDPLGGTWELAGTRFVLPATLQYGAPLPALLACRAGVTCAKSVSSVLTSEVVDLDATASSSPLGEDLTFTWTFDDGTSAEGPVVSHAWPEPGSYAIGLTVTDESGRESTLTHTLQVLNRVPEAFLTPPASVNRIDLARYVLDAHDEDGSIVDIVWYLDGVAIPTARGRTDMTLPLGLPLGTHTVDAYARDDAGGWGVASDTFQVENLLPLADGRISTLGAPSGAPVTFQDLTSDRDGVIASATWDLGDGTLLSGPVVEHAYGADGTYPVTLTVTDNDGGVRTLDLGPVEVDSVPPELVVGCPEENEDGWVGGDRAGYVRCTVSASDARDTDPKVTAWFDGQVVPIYNGVVSVTGSNALHTLRVTARDWAGATTVAEVEFLLDNEAPTAEVAVAGGDIIIGSTTITGRGTDALSGMATVTIFIDGEQVASGPGAEVEYLWDTTRAKAGAHSLVVLTRDNVGNVGVQSHDVLVVNGNVAPQKLDVGSVPDVTDDVYALKAFAVAYLYGTLP